MSRYTVAFRTGAFTYVSVEADSPEEARELADEEFVAPRPCARCSGWGLSPNSGNSGLEVGDDWEQDESDDGVWES